MTITQFPGAGGGGGGGGPTDVTDRAARVLGKVALQSADTLRPVAVTPRAGLAVSPEGATEFFDTFDSDAGLDTTNMWTKTLTGIGAISDPSRPLNISFQNAANASAYAATIPTFLIRGSGSYRRLYLAVALQDGLPDAHGAFVFGFGSKPGAPTPAAPLRPGLAYYAQNGALKAAVMRADGFLQVIKDLTASGQAPVDGAMHLYAIEIRNERAEFFIDDLDAPVASLTLANSNQYGPHSLPIVLGAVSDATAPTAAYQFSSYGVNLLDMAPARVITDGVFPWRRAAVKPASTAPLATDPALVVTTSPNSPASSSDVSDRAGRLLGIVASIAAAVDVSDRAGRALGVVASITAAVDVSDRVGRLLGHVINDASTAVIGHVITDTGSTTVVTGTVDVADRAARLLGIVYGSVGQLTQKAASTLALAADTTVVVQHSPMDARAANLAVTVTAATGVAATLTLPAPAAGLFHYIDLIEIQLYATAARTGGATPILVTSTNLPGNPVWDFETGQAIGTVIRQSSPFKNSLKSLLAATATTIVAPIATTGLWRITAYYHTAP